MPPLLWTYQCYLVTSGGLCSPPLPTWGTAKLGEASAFIIGSCFLTCNPQPASCPGMEAVFYRQNQAGQRREHTLLSCSALRRERKKQALEIWRHLVLVTTVLWIETGYLEAETGVFVLKLVQKEKKENLEAYVHIYIFKVLMIRIEVSKWSEHYWQWWQQSL